MEDGFLTVFMMEGFGEAQELFALIRSELFMAERFAVEVRSELFMAECFAVDFVVADKPVEVWATGNAASASGARDLEDEEPPTVSEPFMADICEAALTSMARDLEDEELPEVPEFFIADVSVLEPFIGETCLAEESVESPESAGGFGALLLLGGA